MRKEPILNSFHSLGLAEPIVRALDEARHVTPTPIQAQAIPHVLAGRDLIGIAQTGTGKTAAFALPILHHLALHKVRREKRRTRVLVLSPTRELSSQIMDSFRTYGRHINVSTTLAIGGVPINRQTRALVSGVDVLVATPGRLLDLVNIQSVQLDHVEVLVLDEADRMLDMGFIRDIRTIVAKLPHKRRTLFFSATMPPAIADLAAHMLNNPARVEVTPVATTAERIDQRIIHVDRAGKPNLLVEVLTKEPIERALVFTRTKHGADKVVRNLEKAGIAAEAIHGNKSQNNRERALAAFRSGQVRTLVATDIAARGIDVTGVSHVINYDLPNEPESYVHRIGRTARAGAEGIAISFCDHEERAYLRDIERLIRLTIPSTDRRTGERHVADAEPRREGRGGPRRQGQGRPGKGRQGQGQGRQGQGRGEPRREAQGDQRRDARPNAPRPAAGEQRRDARAEPQREARAPKGQHHGQTAGQQQAQPSRGDRRPGRGQGQGTGHGKGTDQKAGHGRPGYDGSNIAGVAFLKSKPDTQRKAGGADSRRAPRGVLDTDIEGRPHGERRTARIRRRRDRGAAGRQLPGQARQRPRNPRLHGRQDAQVPHPHRCRRPGDRRDVALRSRARSHQLPPQGRPPGGGRRAAAPPRRQFPRRQTLIGAAGPGARARTGAGAESTATAPGPGAVGRCTCRKTPSCSPPTSAARTGTGRAGRGRESRRSADER